MSGDARSVHRNPLIVWILGAFVLRQLWSSEIMALLVSRGQMKFDSFSQIAKAGKSLKILIEYQSSSYYIFKEVNKRHLFTNFCQSVDLLFEFGTIVEVSRVGSSTRTHFL